jgi:hypothetical protein
MDDDALAHASVGRLIGRYADIATRMAWTEMPGLLTSDVTFTFDLRTGRPLVLDGPDAVVAFGAHACSMFSFYNYTSLNHVLLRSDASQATGRAYALEVGVDASSGAWLEFYGLYHDRYAIQDGEWRFARRHFQTMATRTDGVPTFYEATIPTDAAG